MTQSEAVSITNTTSEWSTTVRDTTTANGSEEQAEDVANKRPDLTDTLAAVTIAILAVILVVTLTLIVRAVRRRRRSERGEELGHIPTVSAGIMGSNVAAYRRGDQRAPQEERGIINWEPVSYDNTNSNINSNDNSNDNSNINRATTSSASGSVPGHC